MGFIAPLGSEGIFPLLWNALISVIVAMVYIKGTIALMEKMVDSGKISSDLSRKIIHIAAGSFIWVWLFLDTSDGLSYLLNITVPFLFFMTFLYKGFKGSPDDPDVKTMSRTGDPRELLKGTLYFTIIMMISGTILFGTYAGMLMMAIVGWGDGIAPYIGKRFGKRKYKTLGREKSIEGSIGVFLFSILGSLIFTVLLGILGGDTNPALAVLADPGVDLLTILIVIVVLALVATIVEAFSPSDVDNLLIPASTIITLIIIDAMMKSTFILGVMLRFF
ncbi:MAG: diacylglycerol/polyprenol kinase family protein [Candidatus Hodarchaeales archaeon]